MRAEIFEQPKVLTQLHASAQPVIADVAAHVQRQPCSYAVLAARGSSLWQISARKYGWLARCLGRTIALYAV